METAFRKALDTGDETGLADLKEQSQSKLACIKAVDLLSRRDHTEKELVRKLLQRGFSKKACQEAIEFSKERGYLDDQRIARQWLNSRKVVSGYSRSKSLAKLQERGLDRESAKKLVDEEFSEANEIEAVIRYLNKHKTVAQDKSIQRLQRQGFSHKVISLAIARIHDKKVES